MYRVITPGLGIGIIIGFVGANSQSTTLFGGEGIGMYEYLPPEVPPW